MDDLLDSSWSKFTSLDTYRLACGHRSYRTEERILRQTEGTLPMRRTEPTENQIQADYFRWCGIMSRKHPELELAFHIPNGSYKSVAARMIFKAIGLKPGVPDVFLPVPNDQYHGLWIEFKTKKGRVSDYQLEWIEKLTGQGFAVLICRSWTDAANVTLNYLGHKSEFNDNGERIK